MISGKKSVSDKLIIDAAAILRVQGYNKPFETRVTAINILKPRVELRTIKKSGQNIQIPSSMRPYRQEGLALRRLKNAIIIGQKSNTKSKNSNIKDMTLDKSGWVKTQPIINKSQRNRKERFNVSEIKNSKIKSISKSLSLEIIHIIKGQNSLALNKRDSLHRRAIAQRGARRN